MSVRARLTRTLVIAIAATAALFSALSIVGIDRALHAGLRARLLTMARATATEADVHHGRVSLDAGDLAHIRSLRAGVPFAVFDAAGNLIGGSTPPAAGAGAHVVSVPIVRGGITYGTAVVWESDLWIGDVDREVALVTVVVALVLIALGALAAHRAAGAALAPLQDTATLAERIEGRDLSLRLHADGDDELGRLCASFDRMLDRLESAFARERRFAADASHELRAPLAVLRAEAELALRRERDVAAYREAIASILRETLRIEELVDELLAAARSEVDAQDLATLDAAEVARAVGERVRPAAQLRSVDVRVEAASKTLARANRVTLERAMLAVAHNAVAFARQGGSVRLLVGETGADQVRIDVADDGPGFSAEALEHATERFWRGDGARPRGGTGLGLSIARTMVEANGGSLALANAPEGGGLVTIRLVAAFT